MFPFKWSRAWSPKTTAVWNTVADFLSIAVLRDPWKLMIKCAAMEAILGGLLG